MIAMGQGFDAEYFPDKNKVEIYRRRFLKYKALGAFVETN
jgi:L-ribulokinase